MGEIVLNRMFTGSFLDDHIGHEIVNLYKDDKGDNYIYIQPYGTYDIKHHNQIGDVLLVRGIEGKHAVEVLGWATELKPLFDPCKTSHEIWNTQEQFIREHKICYDGALLLDIFDRSKEEVDEQPVYLTMKAGKVLRPYCPTYIIYGEEKSITDDKARIIQLTHTNQAKASLKQYFIEDEDPDNNEDVEKLRQLLADSELWTTETEKVNDSSDVDVKETFWDICGVADYELAWSNAIAYYMRKYPELVVEFAKKVCNIDTKIFPIVERETNDIDILLENDETIVVIENKITSKINGIQVNKEKELVGTQLIKYHRKALERSCHLTHPITNYEDWEQSLRLSPKQIRCYILTPNYNPINLESYNTPHSPKQPQYIFDCSKFYKQIFYKDVYDFIHDKHPEDNYFQDFIQAMERHTREYHNDLFEVTKQKFIQQINRIKSK